MKSSGTIFLVVSDMGLGGAERVLLALAEQFKLNYAVHFVCLRRHGALLHSAAPDISMTYLNSGDASRWRIAAVSFWSILRLMRSKPDAILLSTGTGTNLLACAARLFARRGARLIIREACSSKNSTSYVISLLKRLLYPRADGMIGVSDGVAEELKALAGKRQPVASIPNPVDVARLSELAAMPDEALSNFPHAYILTVGRLVTQKNTALLIDSFARIEKSVEEHLVIIGTGPLESKLRSQVTGYGLDAKIHLLGEVSNPHPWFKRASVFVLSSDSEGYPNVLLEALAQGVPVVATDCEFGPRQILEQGRYGKLIAPQDVMGLSEAMLQTLQSRVQASDWDPGPFSNSIIASRYLAFLEQCRND